MKRIGLAAAAAAVGLMATAGAASADNGHHYGHYKHHKHHTRVVTRTVVREVPVRTRTVTRRVVVYRSGQYLPRNYYVNRTYYVQPTVYGLQAPPPGYEWVRVGNDVYLTQTQTGLISQVIANLIH